jgi:hypothetical protein
MVKFDQKPLPGGTIIFRAPDGASTEGVIDESGHYSAKAPLGAVRIAVDNRGLKGGIRPDKLKGQHPQRPDARKEEAVPLKGQYVEIPPRYLSIDTTPLQREVTSAAQTIDIELDSR